MKRAIGIRVSPSVIYFTVVENNSNNNMELMVMDKIVNPKALGTPEQLKYIRNTLSDIIHEFKVSHACIRVCEATARKPNLQRIYIEGVIQELFASSSIKKYLIGQISSISARLEIPRTDFKKLVEGEDTFLEIDDWKELKLEERESILSAICSLEI